jgi:hypothetical protein
LRDFNELRIFMAWNACLFFRIFELENEGAT